MQKLIFYFMLLILSLLAALDSQAQTTVYFFESRVGDKVYSFDPGGRFYHSALKYREQILEAHPYYGAHLVSGLQEVNYHLVAILKSQKTVKNFDAKVKAQLGKPFNLYSRWEDPNSTQCSKLIGQIIGVSPVLVSDGTISLSPDTLYRELKKRGFKEAPIPLASGSK